jgi:hypothetical protein
VNTTANDVIIFFNLNNNDTNVFINILLLSKYFTPENGFEIKIEIIIKWSNQRDVNY